MTAGSAYAWMAALLDIAGSRPQGGRLRQCPAHRDASPSLSVRAVPDGCVAVKCFTGCTTDEVLGSLHCTRLRLRTPPPVTPARYAELVGLRIEFPPVVLRHGHPSSRGFRLAAVHDYGPAVLLRWRSGQHKELLWETRTASGQAIPGLIGITVADLPLYREHEVRQAVALSEPVLVVESESSVDALRGWYATTWAGGAAMVNTARLSKILGGYHNTVVIPDNDTAGLRCLARMEAAGLAPRTLLPEPGEDARDLYARLGSRRFGVVVADALHDAAHHVERSRR